AATVWLSCLPTGVRSLRTVARSCATSAWPSTRASHAKVRARAFSAARSDLYEDRHRTLKLWRPVDAERRKAVSLSPLRQPGGARRRPHARASTLSLHHRAGERTFVHQMLRS